MCQLPDSNEMHQPVKNKAKRKLLILILAFFAVVAGLCFLTKSAIDFYGGIKEAQRLKALHENAQETFPAESVIPSDTENTTPAAAARTEPTEPANTIVPEKRAVLPEYASLLEINPEVIGWIKLDGTRIDYPLLQHSDNEYYLHKSIENKKSARGCVYIDYRNNRELTDPNTLIYAHNMKDGSMFHTLVSYKKKDFFESHRTLRLNTLYEAGIWEVFSVYVVDADKETIDIDYSREGSFKEALLAFQKRSLFKTDTVLDSSDRILTLVTCSYETSNSRTIVHAKYIGMAE